MRLLSKYSVGVYSTEPVDWAPNRSAALQDEVARFPKVAVTVTADGRATIETYTVRYDWPTTTGVISGRRDSDASRLLATTEDRTWSPDVHGDPIGARIVVRSIEQGSRASLA